LIVNEEHVVRKGLLLKKGGLFNRYKDWHMVFLEEPGLLKHGKRDKPIVQCLELAGAQVAISRDSRTKFKVVKGKVTLSFKAGTTAERKAWLEDLCMFIDRPPRTSFEFSESPSYKPNNSRTTLMATADDLERKTSQIG